MWDTVKIKNIENGEEETYLIVGTTESDVLSNPMKISNEAPVWKALMWKKKWTTVKVKSNAWITEYKILEIN
jgi:transcription elongation factor GreA